MSDAAAVDPEEMLVASLASCHMLFFLGFAAKLEFRVDRYADAATGVMGKNHEGKMAMTLVTLHPAATFSGDLLPTHKQIEQLHHDAHEACFIATSIRAEVRCEPAP